MRHLKLYEDLDKGFKVGDQVVFTYLDETEEDFKYDTVYTISRTDIGNAKLVYIKNGKGDGVYFQKEDIRKATPKEIAVNKYNL